MNDDPRYLRAFCAHTEERQLHEPFSRGRWTYATDAVIAIRIPRVDRITEKKFIVGAEELPFPEPKECTLTLPTLPARVFTPCPEMLAVAAKTCARSCPECAGRGKIPTMTRIQIGLNDFNSEYLRTMKMFLRNVRTTRPEKASEALRFVFEGGCGILAPLQPDA